MTQTTIHAAEPAGRGRATVSATPSSIRLPPALAAAMSALTRAAAPAGPRSVRERLDAVVGRRHEALSPRKLRHTLSLLERAVDPSLSEVEGARVAGTVLQWYRGASAEARADCWLLMAERFGPDPAEVGAARAAWDAAAGTPEAQAAEIRLRRAFASRRTRLLQRFAAAPDGLRFLVELRAELQPQIAREPRLLPLEAELDQLLATWFDVAFLELRRLSWDSPASLIEKLIKYEAVHDIRSWADLKNRLDSDRRCYGFFHPRWPDEPLIFVEVALGDALAESITPLLDESAAPSDLARATTAIFYSISNTQPGLKGVSFGDALIKRVVETLQVEFPRLKTFATLSPIPGLRAWMARHAPADLLAAIDQPLALDRKSPVRKALLAQAARYLGSGLKDGRPLDPVARFHLGNGARVERLNWAADPSAKGIKQSYGLMVNYLYDLKRLDRHRSQLAAGRIPVSSEIDALMR